MASAWLSLHIQQGGPKILNSFCSGMPEEMLGEVVGREGVSCPVNIPLNILMERGMLDMAVYLVSDSKSVNSISSGFDRLMSSTKREDLLPDKK